VFSLFKPSHNEHGGMRGGAVHIQEIEKARNSSEYPASGMPPKQKKSAAQKELVCWPIYRVSVIETVFFFPYSSLRTMSMEA
jgi:hypothetical protein